jgi:hypothetical protein
MGLCGADCELENRGGGSDSKVDKGLLALVERICGPSYDVLGRQDMPRLIRQGSMIGRHARRSIVRVPS